MAEQNWVELKHPKVEGTYRAPASAVEHYRKRGWAPVSKAQKQVGVTAPEKKAEGN